MFYPGAYLLISVVSPPYGQQNQGIKIQIGSAIRLRLFTLTLAGISAKVKKFNWSYKKETFPKLKVRVLNKICILHIF